MKNPSMADVAKAAGVSKNTVSLALRKDPQIPDKTQKRIQRMAEKLGYQRNAVVSELMVRMRRTRQPGFQAVLGLINANADPKAFTNHPTIPVYVDGVRRTASTLGYAIDSFWLHDPELRGKSFLRILKSRSIRGLLIVGLMKENKLPSHFQPLIDAFPCIVTGVRTRNPALSFVCADHHMLVNEAVAQVAALGYKRPGMIIDAGIDRLVERRFSAGFQAGREAAQMTSSPIPMLDFKVAEKERRHFWNWYENYRPDVVFTLYNTVHKWLKEAKIHAPKDIGLVQLEWRSSEPKWAGMNQHNDVTGEAAVEMLEGMIHRDESGAPEFPRSMLIGSTWMSGTTVRKQK
ncbi:LacI family DNA-binding transcriptional regulator [Rubellicoccus peritrichatus]|uniref:LacI family DNA-binding transcriptional regulator n=1 Tax=Rubellicoccus peritrichatus TaxID=3080537 RepID=A0AAQ3LI14_9BACT|nr:LacI family DNA-binding transcriptional regulator [Puniceicoccus sp. CR14]WOO42454.1 LacI family DNA-binding transcriptional regulator [Puniceicoccus sp. CR14]